MASVSSAHLVLFIAAVLVAAILAGTATQSATRIGNALDEQSDIQSDHTATELRIVSDAGAPEAIYDAANDTLTLYVKNTGDTTIPHGSNAVTLLVNGTRQPDTTTTVLDADQWRPGTLLRIEANVSLPSNQQTRTVVDANGGRDLFVFTTP
jgi:flagellar protein FlaG